MSLPLPWVNRIFERLTLTYGSEFDARWSSFDEEEMIEVNLHWADELAAYKNAPHAITFALNNLPERAPNVIQFRNLCRQAPAIEPLRIEPPAADPARVAAVLEKIAPVMQQPRAQSNPKAWAHRLLERLQSGERINPTAAQMARTAIGASA